MASRNIFLSSVFRKQVVAVTGLAMVGFIIAHLAGNLLVFLGPEALNHYSDMLHAVPELLWLARIGLIVSVILHIAFTIMLFLENSEARAQPYAVDATKQADNPGFARRSMILTGMIVLLFIPIHLYDFTFTSYEGAAGAVAGEEMRLYGLVHNTFSDFIYVLGYVAAMICIGLHLNHGIQSLFQSLGFNHAVYTPMLIRGGRVLSVIVAVGFSSIPIYLFTRAMFVE